MKTTFHISIRSILTFSLLFISTLSFSTDVYVWKELEDKTFNEVDPTPSTPEDSSQTSFRFVELLTFSVIEDNNNIILDWKTSIEINNDYFTVERSIDINNWEVIGSLPGAGNSSNPASYQFIDHNPNTGISYYRIKQTDYDGVVTYSPVEAVEVHHTVGNITLYPQPVISQVQVNCNNFQGDEIFISILSSRGILIRKTSCYSPSFTLNVSDLKRGIYFLRIEGIRTKPEMIKLVKG